MKLSVSKTPKSRRLHLPFPRHDKTAHIEMNLHACTACGNCAKACPNHVLGIISFGPHRHVHVDYPAKCTGCRACVSACPNHVLAPRPDASRQPKSPEKEKA